MPPDFLAVGHIVKDVDGDEWRLGGSVAYAALQAARLGQSVACVTACGCDLDPVENLGWADWRVVPGGESTIFENRLRDGRRVQRVLSVASPIAIEDIPEPWWHARTVFLAPVIGEVMPDVGEIAAPTSLLGLGCQGWLRSLRATRVESLPFERRPPWLHGDVAFLSEEDLAQPERAADWSKHVPYVVLTRGRHGATIWNEGATYRLPAYPAKVVDETGAGDVFATAFLVRFQETRDPIESGRFAAAAASLCVQGEGLKRIGTRDEIELVLRSYPWALEFTVVLAVANQKGGVGKTTTAVNLGAELAALGVRVLLIDLDPQANATAALGIRASRGETVYESLLDGAPLGGMVLETSQPGLYIVPATPDLAGAEVELVPAMAREFRLQRALAGVTADYDIVIVDCPPAFGLLTLNALAAATDVLIPVQCEYLALEGLTQLAQTIDAVKQNLNPGLAIGGLLLTMFDSRTNLAQQVADEVRAHFAETFKTVIPRNVRVSEAPSHGLPVSQYAPSSPAAKAYRAFAGEFVEAFRSRLATGVKA